MRGAGRWAWLFLLAFSLLLALPRAARADQGYIDVQNAVLERSDEGLLLSAQLRIDLPPIVEDALAKGIPLYFVATTDLKRERWYWYDKRLTQSARYIRLSHQPLLRRWRVQLGSSSLAAVTSSSALGQSFENLADALAAVQRISRWRVAPAGDLESDGSYLLDYQFRLDVSQLPRPIQISVLGQSDWNLSVQRSLRVPDAR